MAASADFEYLLHLSHAKPRTPSRVDVHQRGKKCLMPRFGGGPLRPTGGAHKTLVSNSTQHPAESSTEAAVANYSNRRPSPLARGGTLTGDQSAGKDPGLAVLGKVPEKSGSFEDARWKHGTWDLSKFTSCNGNVDWDAVIDAEVLRRKWLEERPEASLNESPIVFRMSTIPWWAWVRRFHLPEAELINGRAAMVGFVVGFLVDGLTGVGLVDQTNSFLSKLTLLACVLGVMLIRRKDDVENLKQLGKEWSLYHKQWQASWQSGQVPISIKDKK